MSQGDQEIRKATVADAPRIAQMHVESWLETYTGIVPDVILAALGNDKIYCGQRLMKSPESGLSSSTAQGREYALAVANHITSSTRLICRQSSARSAFSEAAVHALQIFARAIDAFQIEPRR